MASVQVFPTGFRLLDTDGNPVSGGKAKFYEAGTSTPKVVYSDAALPQSLGSTVFTRSDGQFVASEGSSTTVLVYTGEDAYKLELTRSNDTVLFGPFDNIVGAPALTPGEAVAPFVSVVTSGSNHTFEAADRGKLFNYTGNTATFPVATVLGDGWWAYVKNAASVGTGRVTLSAASGISWQGTSPTTIYLEPGQCLGIACDGTAYRVFSDAIIYTPATFRPNTPGVIVIADRITSTPSTSIGSRYIVATGFGSFATHDIVTEVASGVFVGTTPTTDCGWVAYVQDEDLYYAFVGSAWVPVGIHIPGLTAEATVDGAADFIPFYDTSGSIQRKGLPTNFKRAGGMQLLNSGTVSAAAQLDIVLTSFTGYRAFKVLLSNFVPATDDVELRMRVSTNGGSSYDAGASDYQYVFQGRQSQGDGADENATANTSILVAGEGTGADSVSNGANEGGCNAEVTLYDTSVAHFQHVHVNAVYITADGVMVVQHGAGIRMAAQDTDAIRFLFETGNIASGNWALYGMA